MSFQSIRSGKPPHIPSASKRPIYKIKNYETWNTYAVIDTVNFLNFKSDSTACGAKQTVFGINDFAADMTPINYITNSKFTNVAYNAIIYIYNPPAAWANIDDCGNWPCTGPSNVVYNFQNTVFEVPDGVTTLPTFWKAGTTTSYNFQIVSNFATAASTYPNCSLNTYWNGWFCADPTQTAAP